MSIGAVIAAANYTVRDKNIADSGATEVMGAPERIAATLKKCGIDNIVVVTGHNSAELKKRLRRFGICFLDNENYENTDTFESVKMGLEYIHEKCERIVYCPSGFPFFSEDTVRALLMAEGDVCIPSFDGRKGHPIVIDSGIVPGLLAFEGEGGLRAAYPSVTTDIEIVPVEDKGIFSSKEDEDEIKRLADEQNRRLIRPEVDISLSGERKIISSEVKQLLMQIDDLGSVREACEKAGLSYSKGWNLIGDSEAELGFKLVDRQQGGKNGGKAALSMEGKRILGLYRNFEEAVQKYAEREYERFFKATLEEMRDRK